MKLNIIGNQPLVAPRDPVMLMEVATKNYVDSNLTDHSADETVHITPAQNLWLDAITVSAAEINALAGIGESLATQLESKVSKAGDTMTGLLTLSGQPTANLHAATKAYVDSKASERVAKTGDIMSGFLTLHANPTATYHASTKQYVDSTVTTHANNFSLHLTAEQNTWIDAITASATEVNQLVGVTSGVQAQIDTKFDKAGGTITGDVTLSSGKTVFVSKVPTADTELVNKAYVDAKVLGQEWKDPVSEINLVSTAANSTAGLAPYEVVIVGASPTGNLTGLSGRAIYLDAQGQVVDLKGAPVAARDRFGVAFGAGVTPDSADLSTLKGKIITITSSIPGSIEFSVDAPTAGTSVLVFDEQSKHFGEVFTFTDEGEWVVTNTSVNLVAGDGLNINGKTVNVQAASGIKIDTNNKVAIDLAAASALTTENNKLGLKLKDSSLSQDADGIRVASQVMLDIEDRVSKSTGGNITGAVTVTTPGSLTLLYTPSAAGHAVPKGYVDAANQVQDTNISALDDRVTVLESDPTTKAYVDSQVGTKVSKAGDTMTGFLTLHANPTSNLHSATKQYVDSAMSTHAGSTSLHLTSTQNTWLDGITVSSTEVNLLAGVTSGIQTQLNAKFDKAGGAVTGSIQVSTAPVADDDLTNKAYVDNRDALRVSKAGSTMTGFLSLHANPIEAMQAATKEYVDIHIEDTYTGLNNSVNTKVSKSGDTMTGFLSLHADPTANLHSATKQYVDSSIATTRTYVDGQDASLQTQITAINNTVNTLNTDPVTKQYVDDGLNTKLNKSGGTLTNYLVLHADPLLAMQAATKQYVDTVAQGLAAKPSVRVATTSNLSATYNNGSQGVNATLTASSNGALVVDGVTLAVGDRVLVKSQTAKYQNGDYVVQQTGSASTPYILKRATLIDESHEVPGSYFYVYDGSTLKGTGWVFTVANPVTYTIGTDDINVNQFSGQGSIIGGAGLTLTGNTLDVVSANTGRIVVNANNIDLATSGVTPGTYTKVVVDGYGRVTTGTSPTTLAGYGIADAQPLNTNLTNLSAVTTNGLLVRDANDGVATRALAVSGSGLSITNPAGGASGDIVITSNATAAATASTLVTRDTSGNFAANVITASLTGNASTATTLKTSRNFAVSGDATAPAVSFNGSANVTLALTLANTGVTAGDYTKVTVDSKGRVTAASNPSTVADMGLTDAATIELLNQKVAELENKLAELHLYVMGRM